MGWQKIQLSNLANITIISRKLSFIVILDDKKILGKI